MEDEVVPSSFKAFLDRYRFDPIDYNDYDIVNKNEVIIKTASKINVDDTLNLTFTDKSKKVRVAQLVKQLIAKDENDNIHTCGAHSLNLFYRKILDMLYN